MKYIRLFENDSDYTQYVGERGADYVEPHVVTIKNSVNVYYKELPMPEKISKYLTIEALEDGLTVSLSRNDCQYSLDEKTWVDLPANTTTPVINTGDMISFKATGLTPNSNRGIGTFTVDKNFNLKGNVMSMLFGDEGENSFDLTGYDNAFIRLFYNCTKLQSVSKDFLPATTLVSNCYKYMFKDCTSLVTAPELPSTTLTSNCYMEMFYGCTSLVTAPELPATTLTSRCYERMFEGCTSLNYIKTLFTTEPSSLYTMYWVNGVSSTGTFVKNASATWNVTGMSGIPEGWTVETV